MLLVLVLTVIGWVFAPRLHVDAGTVSVVGLLGAVVSGNFDRTTLQELDWSYLIFYAVAISLGRLVVTLGLDRVAAESIGAQLSWIATAPALFVLVAVALTLLVRLLLPPNQTTLLVSLALIPVAPSIGIEPWVAVIVILAVCNLWFVPSQNPNYLFAVSACEDRLFSSS